MYTPTSILPARIVRSLRGSKRRSKRSSTKGKPAVADETPSSIFEDEGNSCFDDFEEITYDEVLPDLDHETSTLDTRSLSPLTPGRVPEISAPFSLSHNKLDNPRLNHSRSKSVSHTLPELSLSRSHSRSSLPLFPHSRQSHSRSRVHLPTTSTESLLSEFPKPPTHVPTSPPRHITLVDPPPATDSRRPRPQEQAPQLEDPNTQFPSPPSTRPSSPSTIAPSDSRSTITFYRRFQSFRSSLRLPRRSKSSRNSKHVNRDAVPASVPQVTEINPTPSVVPEPIDSSRIAWKTPDPSTSGSTAALPVITVQTDSEQQEEESDTAEPPQSGCLQAPRITYELVDPLTLTRSPSGCPTPELDSLTGTPLPSPSWLSRNVQYYQYPSHVEPQPPPSPPPLFVPPPVPVGYIPPPPDPAFISEEEFQSTRILHTPSRPTTPSRHAPSYTPRYCPDRCSSPWKRGSPTVVGQSSPHLLHRSNSFTQENSPAPRGLLFLDTLPRTLSAPDLLAVPSSDNPSLLTPIELFQNTYPSQPSASSAPPPPPAWQQEPVPTSGPPQGPTYEFFVPPPRNQDTTQDQFFQRLPQHILFTVINVLLREASLFSQEYTRMSFNIFGKPMETVDIGQEVDYANYEWFKDPPPPTQMAPSPAAEPFVPQPGVIEQNEMFEFALKSAPNVLYSKYKQFGQLGVLGWCAEFSELIDALKQLGFEGNMFVSTRIQALNTCSEILQLHLEIKMQIIVMYLSAQVQRLRRFLDAQREWNDYPTITFPLPPQEAQRQ